MNKSSPLKDIRDVSEPNHADFQDYVVAQNMREDDPNFTPKLLHSPIKLRINFMLTEGSQDDGFPNEEPEVFSLVDGQCIEEWQSNLKEKLNSIADDTNPNTSFGRSPFRETMYITSTFPTSKQHTEQSKMEQYLMAKDKWFSHCSANSPETEMSTTKRNVSSEKSEVNPSEFANFAELEAKPREVKFEEDTTLRPELEHQKSSPRNQWLPRFPADASAFIPKEIIKSSSDEPSSDSMEYYTVSQTSHSETQEYCSSNGQWIRKCSKSFSDTMITTSLDNLTCEKETAKVFSSPKLGKKCPRFADISKRFTKTRENSLPKSPFQAAPKQPKKSPFRDQLTRCSPFDKSNSAGITNDTRNISLDEFSSDSKMFYTIQQSPHHHLERQEFALENDKWTSERSKNSEKPTTTTVPNGIENADFSEDVQVKPSKFPKSVKRSREIRFANNLSPQTGWQNKRFPPNKQRIIHLASDNNSSVPSENTRTVSRESDRSSCTNSPIVKSNNHSSPLKKKWMVNFGSNRNYIKALVNGSQTNLPNLSNTEANHEHKKNVQVKKCRWVIKYDNMNYIRSKLDPDALERLLKI